MKFILGLFKNQQTGDRSGHRIYTSKYEDLCQ